MKDVVIIPTYNEKENIEPLIQEILSHAPEVHVMVVDDNSPDGTGKIVSDLARTNSHIQLLARTHKDGLGGAYLAGFRQVLANGFDRIITMDGDFSHSPHMIPQLLDQAQSHDLVIGSRYTKGGGIPQWEPWRRFLSAGANVYVRLILGHPVADWTSGFNAIRADALRRVPLDSLDLSGYAFLQELKYALIKSGSSFKEIPIIFGARRGGESKISAFIIREGITGPWKMRFKK